MTTIGQVLCDARNNFQKYLIDTTRNDLFTRDYASKTEGLVCVRKELHTHVIKLYKSQAWDSNSLSLIAKYYLEMEHLINDLYEKMSISQPIPIARKRAFYLADIHA